jgi:predicted dehydrogenase
MAEYRVAVVGCGGISRAHIGGYKACQRINVVAGMDLRPEQLEKWGKDFGVTALYTNLDEMMDKVKPDIVSVCTYPDTHCELTVKIASYGVKGIICEKPMALNMEQAERMIAECDKHKVKLVIGHQRRHAAQHQFTKRLIDRGEIGKLVALWGSSPSNLMDWGTHVVDMMIWYAGDVEWVMGQVDITPIKKDPTGYRGGYFNVTPVVGYFKFKSKAVGFFETDLQNSGTLGNPRIHIRGDKGEVEVIMDGGVKYSIWDAPNWTSPSLTYKDAFHLEVEDLCNCIEQDKTPLDSGKDGAKALEVLMAISESARVRGKVSLPLAQKAAPLDLMAQDGILKES